MRQKLNYVSEKFKRVIFITLETSSYQMWWSKSFRQLNFESLWVKCCWNFSRNCKSKLLLYRTYNPLKKYQFDLLLELLITNPDNASCECFMGITLMGDFDFGHEKNLDEGVLFYGFTVATPCWPTRVCKSTKTHIDYLLAEKNFDEKKMFFVFDTLFKTDHLCSILFTE